MLLSTLSGAGWIFSVTVLAQTAAIVSLPYEYTYLLPNNFEGVVPNAIDLDSVVTTFANSTRTSSDSINDALAQANDAAFISYSDEFLDLLGPSPNVRLVEDRPGDFFAFEGRVWLPDRNEAWLTSALYQQPSGVLSVLHLTNNTISRPAIPAPYKNFQRGVYDSRARVVYMTTYRDNETYSGAFVSIDPETFEISTVFNSYFGLRFNALNDPTWLPHANETGARYMFISDIQVFLQFAYNPVPANQLLPTLYRFDLTNNILQPVLTGTQQPTITGNKMSPDLKNLYVADGGDPTANVAAAQVIYKYDINEDAMPVNQRVFAVPRLFVDAIHVDDRGRVWTSEGDGIVVRNRHGRLLGVFNRRFFGREGNPPFGNFVLCGDVVVVMALDRVWTVQLSENVLTPQSRHVFG